MAASVGLLVCQHSSAETLEVNLTLGGKVAGAAVSPCLYTLSYIPMQCHPPLQQLHSDFRDAGSIKHKETWQGFSLTVSSTPRPLLFLLFGTAFG